MTREPSSETARRLKAGLNGDADQRAATALLAEAGHGLWLGKLADWPECLRPLDDIRRPAALYIDWHQPREDLIADDRVWAVFNDWSTSLAGRQAPDDEYERRLANLVPCRPWHGAGSSELVRLGSALKLAPGGLLGDGVARLDTPNRAAVLAVVREIADH